MGAECCRVWNHGIRWRLSALRRYELLASDAPEADPSTSELYFYSGSTSRTIEVANRGATPLRLEGYFIDDARFTVTFSANEVQPNEAIDVEIAFADDGNPVDASLCMVTNDPDESVQNVLLASTSSGSAIVIGEAAKDFTLTDLDGQPHTLSDQIGNPVVLVYFATW